MDPIYLFSEILLKFVVIQNAMEIIHWYMFMILPGQQMVRHDLLSTLEPGQSLPLQKGTGLSHLLVHLFVPPPHVLLHDPHIHGPHLPV